MKEFGKWKVTKSGYMSYGLHECDFPERELFARSYSDIKKELDWHKGSKRNFKQAYLYAMKRIFKN